MFGETFGHGLYPTFKNVGSYNYSYLGPLLNGGPRSKFLGTNVN
jgi:hypothetical protein